MTNGTDTYAALDTMSEEALQAFKVETAGSLLPEDMQERSGDYAVLGTVRPFDAAEPVLVAEGDSWFDYLPGTDIIDCLKKFHNFRIKSFADAGDTLENMIYGTEYGSGFSPKPCQFQLVLEAVDRLRPKVFLFSGGGNDIAGTEFEAYLDHAGTKRPDFLRQTYVEHMFEYFEAMLKDMIDRVLAASPETTIIMHGYAPPLPSGRGVQFLGFKFAGPWLRPALAKKRITDFAMGAAIVARLINRYNAMLGRLAATNSRFLHADLRPLIDPKNDWVNELHLRNSAYARVADHLAAMINSLP
ncbi:hypothetical protein [Solidesulfovibrio sp.]